MPRFLLFLCVTAGLLQTNAHSGAIPKSFSSSESQLHGGAGLGTTFFAAAVAVKGTNVNGETRCLRSVIVIVACVVYYNARIIIHIHIYFYVLFAAYNITTFGFW